MPPTNLARSLPQAGLQSRLLANELGMSIRHGGTQSEFGRSSASYTPSRKLLPRFDAVISQSLPFGLTGRVSRLSGLAVAAADFPAPLGAWCEIERQGQSPIRAEVVGLRDNETILLCESDMVGVRRGSLVSLTRSVPTIRVGKELLGRVLNGSGIPIDGRENTTHSDRIPFTSVPVTPLDRPRIETVLSTGVRTIDAFLTCGVGQRMGIFAGSGVGKSVLLGQISRHCSADVNVVVLIGERGREVREFIEDNLGSDGLAKSVVVAATSDESPLVRRRAAHVGSAIAEHFRELGHNVLLVVDSITRLALAQREIGLAAGEPPATRGFPPSVFSQLARVLERSGRTHRGSITGLYTVLVEGDDPQEPIADAVRGTLDGHIVLDRTLAEKGCFPAIDVLASLSRVMQEVVDDTHHRAAVEIRKVLAAYQQHADLISIGAYQNGSHPLVDVALRMQQALWNFRAQSRNEFDHFDTIRQHLLRLAEACRQR